MRDPLSFSPGFNRVDAGAFGNPKNRFQRFSACTTLSLELEETVETVKCNELYAVITRLKPCVT